MEKYFVNPNPWKVNRKSIWKPNEIENKYNLNQPLVFCLYLWKVIEEEIGLALEYKWLVVKVKLGHEITLKWEFEANYEIATN